MKPIIRVENLSKQYQLGGEQKTYSTLRESLVETAQKSLKMFKRGQAKNTNSFWALQDINFEVMPGEVVGIIGRNGAGKSTLLKILSRITEPTVGRIELYGRVGSLLEVGTGFHPELTGRENIYLNSAILGMRREEIAKKFDEIVDFAEIEQFLDTPVKHYSSGMYTRLAFAVAANLEPEILVVDEVLAVGDAEFQKKCLGKMKSVSDKEGRTVLFVSHNMAAVTSLCSRCVLLNKGQLIKDGSASEIISIYQRLTTTENKGTQNLTEAERFGTGKAQFKSIEISGQSDGVIEPGDNLKIKLEIAATQKIFKSNVAIIIYDSNGYRLIDISTAIKGDYLDIQENQTAEIEFELFELLLKPNTYTIGLWLGRASLEEIDSIPSAVSFTVNDARSSQHSLVYPGVYQCRFDQKIQVHSVHDN